MILSSVDDLWSKKEFYINAYVTLTFDLVTLTLGQLYRPININNICEYHQDPSIRSWFIGEKS